MLDVRPLVLLSRIGHTHYDHSMAPRKTVEPDPDEPIIHQPRPTLLDALVPHPRNYRQHPPDQVAHLKASLTEHGAYRNLIAARGNVLLAGHGVAQAAQELGWDLYPVVHLDIEPDSPQALKILAADNTLSHFAFDDDRALTNLLRDVSDTLSLLGTGYDEASLAAQLMVTRPATEIADFDAAAEWVGMPDYENAEPDKTIVLHFPDAFTRDEWIRDNGLVITNKVRDAWSSSYPFTGKMERVSVSFIDESLA